MLFDTLPVIYLPFPSEILQLQRPFRLDLSQRFCEFLSYDDMFISAGF